MSCLFESLLKQPVFKIFNTFEGPNLTQFHALKNGFLRFKTDKNIDVRDGTKNKQIIEVFFWLSTYIKFTWQMLKNINLLLSLLLT